MKCKKSRYWTFLIYPDSAPSNWYELLEDLHLPICISPLHDKDTNPDGEPKKPHYHVMICWEGPTSQNNVQDISNLFSGVLPFPVASVKGMYNYFTHKDNPDKFQYDSKDIVCISGFNIDDYKNYTSNEILEIRLRIDEFIKTHMIFEYFELREKLIDYDLELYTYASNNTQLYKAFLDSKRHFIKK